MSLYNLCSNPSGDLPFTIVKFDSDLNAESVYEVGPSSCTCPAGQRPSCRHRQMLPKLRERVDSAWFWNFESSAWCDPTGEATKHAEVAEHDKATGGLDADMQEALIADGEKLLALTDKDHGPHFVDEGSLSNPSKASPLGNEAASGFRRRV